MNWLWLLSAVSHWWIKWAAVAILIGFLLSDSSVGDESDYTQTVKSLLAYTLTVQNYFSCFGLGGIGRGWVIVQEAAATGWDLAGVGLVLLSCVLRTGCIMGWAGDMSGGWVVNPDSVSSSYLVVCLSLFVWSVVLMYVPLPFYCRSVLVRGQNWCGQMGFYVNLGDMSKVWLGGLSLRCSPPCTLTPMPETELGFSNLVTFVYPVCSWGGIVGWVLLKGAAYIFVCGFEYPWVFGSVLYWALESWQSHFLSSFKSWKHQWWGLNSIVQWSSIHSQLHQLFGASGMLGNNICGQLLIFNGSGFSRYTHSCGYFGWQLFQINSPLKMPLLGNMFWLDFSPGSWKGTSNVTSRGFDQVRSNFGFKWNLGLYAVGLPLGLMVSMVPPQVLYKGPAMGGKYLVLGCGSLKAQIQVWILLMEVTSTKVIVLGLGGYTGSMGHNKTKVGDMNFGSMWYSLIFWAYSMDTGMFGLISDLADGFMWAQSWLWVAVKYQFQAQLHVMWCGGAVWYLGLASLSIVYLGWCNNNRSSGLLYGLASMSMKQNSGWPSIKSWFSLFGLMFVRKGKEISKLQMCAWKSMLGSMHYLDVLICYMSTVTFFCNGNVFPCRTSFLLIPSLGCMVSYFWSPKFVLGDMTGGMPPLKV